MKRKNKQHIPFRIRLVFLTRNWVWLFWLVLLPIVWIMLPLERISRPIAGFVTAETENVGAFETSRIRAIHVAIGQQVEPGDILVEVESVSEQKEKLDILDYTVKRLSIEQNAHQQEQNIFSMEMRTRQVIEDIRVSIALQRMDQTRDRATLEGLRQEYNNLEPLVKQGIISDLELVRLRPQITTLTKTLESYPAVINTLNARLASAEAELNQIKRYTASQQPTLSGIHEEILPAMGSTINRLEQGEVAYLYAKSIGVISHIPYNVGDIVPSGTPIVRSTSLTTITITGILRPYQVEFVKKGMTLRVVPPYRSKYKHYYAIITSIEPEILNMPDPFVTAQNQNNRLPINGQRMTLTLSDESHDFIPGENVYIFLPNPTFKDKVASIFRQIQWNIDEKMTRKQ